MIWTSRVRVDRCRSPSHWLAPRRCNMPAVKLSATLCLKLSERQNRGLRIRRQTHQGSSQSRPRGQTSRSASLRRSGSWYRISLRIGKGCAFNEQVSTPTLKASIGIRTQQSADRSTSTQYPNPPTTHPSSASSGPPWRLQSRRGLGVCHSGRLGRTLRRRDLNRSGCSSCRPRRRRVRSQCCWRCPVLGWAAV